MNDFIFITIQCGDNPMFDDLQLNLRVVQNKIPEAKDKEQLELEPSGKKGLLNFKEDKMQLIHDLVHDRYEWEKY